MIEVTAAVICRQDRFLICRRPEGKSCAGLWEFPGGKIEPGESGEDCILRECLEELDIRLKVERKLTEVINEYPGRTVHLHFYLCTLPCGEPTLKEHSACVWIHPRETDHYDFCPADRKMLDSQAWKNFSASF